MDTLHNLIKFKLSARYAGNLAHCANIMPGLYGAVTFNYDLKESMCGLRHQHYAMVSNASHSNYHIYAAYKETIDIDGAVYPQQNYFINIFDETFYPETIEWDPLQKMLTHKNDRYLLGQLSAVQKYNEHHFLYYPTIESKALLLHKEQSSMWASIKTFEDLINVRNFTGILRISEHHLVNGYSTIFECQEESCADKAFVHYENLLQKFSDAAFLVERNAPRGAKEERAFNAFFNVNGFSSVVVNVAASVDIIKVNAFKITNVPEKAERLLTEVWELMQAIAAEKPTVVSYVAGFSDDGPIIDKREIKRTFNVPKPHFYPQLGMDPQTFIDSFINDPVNNLLVLIGPPGTGKSSLLRQLARTIGDAGRIYQINGDRTLLNPKFDPYLATLPKGSLVILEDADNLIRKREDGNDSGSMLLNELDGICSKDIKFVISTNLPTLKDVDEGLLRIGRLHSAPHIATLTKAQAEIIVRLEGLPIERIKDGVTLSEVLNGQSKVIPAAGVGFL